MSKSQMAEVHFRLFKIVGLKERYTACAVVSGQGLANCLSTFGIITWDAMVFGDPFVLL